MVRNHSIYRFENKNSFYVFLSEKFQFSLETYRQMKLRKPTERLSGQLISEI